MCSIAGIIAKRGGISDPQHAEMGHLLTAMHHRGPDARDAKQVSDTVLLGSNRLRITDPQNPKADMPMVSNDRRFTIVFNGEIYNHQDIRDQLRPHRFRTNSDTETLMVAYQKWGKDCLEKLEGMYAFAIHDAQTGETFMASDPTGQKSIYMYENDDAIVFASEMNALVSNPHRQKSWDQEGLAEIVAHRFIVGDNTHVKEIRKLTPGTFATMSKERGFEQKPFYQVPIGDQSRDDVAAIQADIRKAVIDGNRRTFNLEVPYGMLLSGGIDSTLVLGQAHARGLPMKTYSVGFRPTDERISGAQTMFNEFPHSRAVAERYGTDHTEIELTDVDYCEYLDRWCEMSGEVLGSQEAPCLIKLFETVGQDARVIFSGSGPDELFDGYSYGKRMSGTPLGALPEKYFDSFHWSGDVDLQRLMPGMDARGITAAKYRRFLEPYGDQVQDALQATQLIHFHGRLGAYEFRQMDTISMAHSVEARSPLVDRALIAAAFNFDPALKQMGGEKGIFKQSLRGLVPDEIIDRKKAGFPIPEEIWFSKPFEDRAQILFEPGSQVVASGVVDADYMKAMWERRDVNHRNIFSRLYTLENILRRQAPELTPRPDAGPHAGPGLDVPRPPSQR